MTLEEKAAFCSGQDFWTTRAIARLQLPSIWLSDGPHGLRKAGGGMMGQAQPATCFPTASALASSWDVELLERCGRAIACEAQASGVHVVLGPGVNMKRSPLGGRNFEYFSEDPRLSGKMAAAQITGMQAEGVGACLKHFAANNQETERFTSSSDPDPRTLHEVYLAAFETAVKEARPWSLMAAYNKLYGTYATESALLLRRILKDQWGYGGVVVSDWGAVDDPVAALRAGMHLEMPGTDNDHMERLIAAVRDGSLEESTLDAMVGELLRAILAVHATHRPEASFDADAHHALAHELAAASMVLLKNDQGLLPLAAASASKVAVIGGFAKHPRYQGSGSSQVNPTRLSNAFEPLALALGDRLAYAEGYLSDGETTDALVSEAVAVAAGADVAIVFAGVPEVCESEGFDRTHLFLPAGHDRVIAAVAQAQPRTVVVLMNGSAVAMPWAEKVGAILEAWLGGQASGEAIADILTGRINPSGKLSETFPRRIEDTPAYPYFPARDGVARYGEGLLIGYRHYDTRCVAPLFPFGHGLSYTRFAYGAPTLSAEAIKDTDTLQVSVPVANVGARAGQEVVQLYVRNRTGAAVFPDKELRHFAKVALEAGETKTVTFALTFRDFAYFEPSIEDWLVASGDYDVLVGASSQDVRDARTVTVEATRRAFAPLTRNSLLKQVGAHPHGKVLYRTILEAVAPVFGMEGKTDPEALTMFERMIADTLIHKFVETSEGRLSEHRLDALLAEANAAAPAAQG
ncbi:glycoside hydrolase family 3 C-terminal domain-containing protein [bacterium]|nr:glycoside hydrolase family 3 C-terminal domain-containing protein [bacterium]